jgi:hypothetical protein
MSIDPASMEEALRLAREEALQYRRAYELVSVAFSENTAELYGRKQLADAYDQARLHRIYGPADVVCYEYWSNAGAAVSHQPSGAVVVTPQHAWHYAAGVPLDFSGIDFETQDCWVRVRLGGVTGQVGVALYDGAQDAIAAQEMVDSFAGVRQLSLEVKDAAASLLLLRNGEAEGVSQATFVGAEIVVADKPAPLSATDAATDPVMSPPPGSWRELAVMQAARRAKGRLQLRLVDAAAAMLAKHGAMLDRRLLTPAVRAASWWRRHVSAPRTLWGVSPILTLPLLARADRLLGLGSASVVYTTYVISSGFDINLKRLMGWIYEHRPALYDPAQNLILQLSRLSFDVYHYFCDRGLSPHKRIGLNEPELQLLQRSDRRLYAYAFGGDVRTRRRTLALGVHNLCVACPSPGTLCICDDERGQDNQAMIARYAAAVVSMGDMVAYAPHARSMPYWPLDTEKVRFKGVDWTPDRPLRVAHAPNHPYFKGTDHLVAAIDRLRGEGRAIELVRVQGVPNTEVIKLFEQSDIIADQFVAGAHGYTAFEAMLVGKPVLCYLRDPSMVLDPDHCPIINTWPESLYRTLRDCLDGRYDLADIGRRGRSYVEHYHSIPAVALRLGQMYLETAGFPERINRRIRRRMARLSASLPPLTAGPTPVPWADIPGADPRPALAA